MCHPSCIARFQVPHTGAGPSNRSAVGKRTERFSAGGEKKGTRIENRVPFAAGKADGQYLLSA